MSKVNIIYSVIISYFVMSTQSSNLQTILKHNCQLARLNNLRQCIPNKKLHVYIKKKKILYYVNSNALPYKLNY